MLSTTLRRQCTGAALPRGLRTLRTTSRLTRPIHIGHARPLPPSFPRTAQSLTPQKQPRSVGSNTAFTTPPRHLASFRRAFHATTRRHDDFSFDVTDGAVAAIVPFPVIVFAYALCTRRGRFLTLVFFGLLGGSVAYQEYELRHMPLEDLRVQRILFLITRAEIERRTREEEEAAAAAGAAAGGGKKTKPRWTRGRKAHAASTNSLLDKYDSLIMARLKKETYAATAGVDDALMKMEWKPRADRLLEMDREIARVVMDRASELKREDYDALVKHLVTANVSDECAEGFAKALSDSDFVARAV